MEPTWFLFLIRQKQTLFIGKRAPLQTIGSGLGYTKKKTTSDPKKGWVWSDGSNFTNPEQWELDEPKNEDGGKYCAQVFSQDRKWYSEDCGLPDSSICKKKKGLPDPTESPPNTEGKPHGNPGAIAGGITGAILFVIIVVVIVLLVRRRILKKHDISERTGTEIYPPRRPKNRFLPETADVKETTLTYVDVLENWEIAPGDLVLLDTKLGEGQFGIVRQGLLSTGKGDSEVVAVKTLKAGAKTSDLEDLKMELTLLKEANKIPHPNVIRFVGGCSIKGKLHIITEFCSGGSLRKFLVNSRVKNPSDSINMTSTLSYRKLLKLAVDVANGMAHISSQKLVHRDLAARNILIGDDDTAKVSDFGLARDIKELSQYTRISHNLLPLKWMAVESLSHDYFTTASDVWSYGILLYEITTLGEEPYKHIPPRQVVAQVGRGYRMPQPSQCSDELYEIMARCWKTEPTERPTFVEIYELLHSMLMANEKSFINITQVLDKGSPTAVIQESKNSSSKDDVTTVNSDT